MKSAMKYYRAMKKYLKFEKRMYDKVIVQRPGLGTYFAVDRINLKSLRNGKRDWITATRLIVGTCLNQKTGQLVDALVEAQYLERDSHMRPATDFFVDLTRENLGDYDILGKQGVDGTLPFHIPSLFYECPISNPAKTHIERSMR